MTPDERWLAAQWPRVQAKLPAPPARVVEIGCGPLGGFVPMLRAAGYEATGVDPEAPAGPGYRQCGFEQYESPEPAGALVACTSLHHVGDLGVVLDLARAALAPGGVFIVIEWARERLDEATARWCFGRLPEPGGEPGWLHEHHTRWRASGQPWDAYLTSWARAEGLHAGREIVSALSARFDSEPVSYGPYFFAELAGTSEVDEQAAIAGGQIQANRIDYTGRRR